MSISVAAAALSLLDLIAAPSPVLAARECRAPWPSVVVAEWIFVGRVLSVTEHPARAALFSRAFGRNPPIPADSAGLQFVAHEARISVDSLWQGADSAALTVFTDASSEGAPFVVGARLLVVAERDASHGVLVAHVCTGTVAADESEPTRKAYRLRTPRGVHASVRGQPNGGW